MRTGIADLAPVANRRIVYCVDSMRHSGWKYAWMLLALFFCLFLLGELEPEAAEAVNSMFGLGGIACVLWGIWQLMQHDS